jgi:hypothetical protein
MRLKCLNENQLRRSLAWTCNHVSEETMTRKNRSTAKSKTQGKATKRRSVPYERLTEHARGIYDQVTGLVTDVRGDKGPWPELLKKHHLSSRKARESAGRDLLGGTRGKPVRASKADRRVRDLLFPMPTGDVPIRTRSSRDATKLSDYYNDREKLLNGKLAVAKFEAKWRGARIAGEEVLTDVRTIFEMAEADVLKMDSLYASVESEK